MLANNPTYCNFQMLTISLVVLGAKHLIYVYPIYPMDDDLEPSNQ